MSERNKAAARAEFEVWSTGELDRLDELVAPDVVHHDPYDPHASEGLDGLKKTIRLNRTAFPDMRITVEDQVAEGDKVTTRWTATMTHEGELGGAAPTGKRATIAGITIERSRTARSSRPGGAWIRSACSAASGRSRARSLRYEAGDSARTSRPSNFPR
ncbi:MAG TPA: ester cyclase [Solirubrobacterales bacterium]|nr:ester cyclase [Solirubrobacterales bacterium]